MREVAGFEALYAAHRRHVVAYCRRRAAREDAYEAADETLLIAWRRFDEIPAGLERAWLYGVAWRVLANQHRGARRRRPLGDRLAHVPLTWGHPRALCASRGVPSRAAWPFGRGLWYQCVPWLPVGTGDLRGREEQPVGLRKDRHPHLDALRAVPLFEGVDDRHLRSVAEQAERVSVPAGELLMLERFHGEQFLIIVEGSASVRHGSQEVARVGQGDFLGEIGLLEHADRSATVVALTPMKLLVIDEGGFQDLLRENPEVAARVQREAALRMAANEGDDG